MTSEEVLNAMAAEVVKKTTTDNLNAFDAFGLFHRDVPRDLALSVAVGVFMNQALRDERDVEGELGWFLENFTQRVREFNNPEINASVEHNRKVYAKLRDPRSAQ